MPAFLSYSTQAAISDLGGGTDYELDSKSFINNTGVVALALGGYDGVYLHDLDFDNNLGCIYLLNCTGQILIEDIRARETGDGTIGSGHSNIIQLNGCTEDGTGGIRRVYGYGGNTEDMISIYQSGGTNAGLPLVIEDCHLDSPLPPDALAWSRTSGSGLMIGDSFGSFIVVQDCTLLNCGQVGIGMPRPDHAIIRNNVLYGAQRASANVGIYTPFTGAPYTGNNEVSGNRIFWKNAAGSNNTVFNGGTSGTVAGFSPQTNILNDTTIDPADLAIDPTTMAFAGGSPPSGPTVLSRAPTQGDVSGGTEVVVGGTGFTGAVSVQFGGTEAASFNVDADDQITAVTPAHAAGTVQIVVS